MKPMFQILIYALSAALIGWGMGLYLNSTRLEVMNMINFVMLVMILGNILHKDKF
jgi:hypothetical protein